MKKRLMYLGVFQKVKKYTLCSLLILAGCGCITGCKNKTQKLTELEENTDITVRQEADRELSGIESGYEMSDFQVTKDKAWVSMVHDGKQGCTYIVDLNDWSARQIIYEQEFDFSLGGEFDKDESFTTFSYDSFPLRFFIKRYDSEGKIVLNQEVTSFITQVRTEGEDVAEGCIVGMHTVQNKQIVIMEYQIVVLMNDGQKAEYVSVEDGKVIDSAKMKDGKIICVIEKENGNRYFEAWNPDNMKWEDAVKITNYWSFTRYLDYSNKRKGVLLNGEEYDFYFKNFYYIYGINWDDKTYVKLIDNEKSGIDNQHDEAVSMLPVWNGMMLSTRDDEDVFKIYLPKKGEEGTD